MSWQNTSNKLAEILPESTHSLWIRPLQCLRFDEEIVELAGPDRFFCSWIKDNYITEIKSAITELGNSKAEIIFSVNEKPEPSKELAANTEDKQLRLPSFPKVRSNVKHLNPRYVFDEFIVGESNEIAHSACQALANGDTSFGRCLYINAETGLGKSHLTHAVAHHLINFAPGTRLNYLSSKQLTAEMVMAIKSNCMEQFKSKYSSCDVLLMEDMPALTGKAKTQEEIASFLDVLLETGKTVIFTGSVAPKEIAGLNPEVRSRLSSGLVTRILPPTPETRARIIRKKAQNYNLELSDNVTDYLADSLIGDIRKIKSAIVGLKAKSSLRRSAPTIEMAKEILADIIDRHQSLTPEIIRNFVAQQYNISLDDIKSKSRKQNIAFPRQVSMYLSRKYTEKGLTDIGKAFNRDHSTVVHSVKRVTESIARNNSIRGQVELLSAKIQQQYL